MKFTAAAALLFGLTAVSANPLVQKRATTSDKATIGYATLSGGTTGGGSATAVTVTSLDAFKTAISNGSKVIIISGSWTGNEVVTIPSDTTILGKSGASCNIEPYTCSDGANKPTDASHFRPGCAYCLIDSSR
ncbi:hypothetical protein FRC06_005317, partial [Ceratobasidium sp. 370]